MFLPHLVERTKHFSYRRVFVIQENKKPTPKKMIFDGNLAFTLPVGIGERRKNKKTQIEHIFLEGNESLFHLMEGRECSQIRLLRIVFNTHTHTHKVKESKE